MKQDCVALSKKVDLVETLVKIRNILFFMLTVLHSSNTLSRKFFLDVEIVQRSIKWI
jgi:hypothetical protein